MAGTGASSAQPIFQVADTRCVTDDGECSARGGLRGQDIFWIALAGSIAAFTLLILKPNRALLKEASAEQALLGAEISQLEERVQRLRSWERSLRAGDREAWSSVARERLGFLSPGERLIALPETDDRRRRARENR